MQNAKSLNPSPNPGRFEKDELHIPDLWTPLSPQITMEDPALLKQVLPTRFACSS